LPLVRRLGWVWGRRAASRSWRAALALSLLAAGAAWAAEPPSVLLIYADPRLVPAIVTIDQTVRSTIESKASSPVRFYSEYLDTSWFAAGHESHVGRALRQKYAGRTFDLIMPCGESALQFALEQRAVLFPAAPMVFCLVEDAALAWTSLPADVTGVTMLRDWAAQVDLVLALHPSTRRIAFISGAGAVERQWEQLARETFSRYADRLTFTYLSGLPMPEIVDAVAALGEGTVILFNVFLRDGAGRTFSSPEALARVAPVAKVPIYGSGETQIGHGIVGGRLVSYEAQARRAGELALRVLAGEPLGPADVVRRLPGTYVFDARQLARWGISERRLPPDSVVMFRTPSLWREYRIYLVGGLAVAVVETLLIVALLLQRRQRRRAQQRIDEMLQFEILLADLAAAFVEVPAGEIDARIHAGLDRIVQSAGIDRAGLGEFVAPDDGDAAGIGVRMTHVRTREGTLPLPGVFTTREWPWIIGRLRDGHAVSFARLTELPAEAVTDRESCAAFGTKSLVLVPIVVGGGVVGALGCGMAQHEREWPDELVQRLRVLADTFAFVLMRRRGDRALAESEGRFSMMADATPIMMWIAGPDGRCTGLNRAWREFTGRPLAADLGEGWVESVHADDRDACLGVYRAALAERRAFTLEYRLRRADGVYRDVLDTGVPRFEADQRFDGFVGSVVDVTEIKAAQRTVVESFLLRNAILGSLYGPVAALDRDGVILAVNEAWSRSVAADGVMGAAAVVGENYLDACRGAGGAGNIEARAAVGAMDSVLCGETSRAMLEYPSHGSRGIRWYTMIVEPLRRPEGGLVISHIDITRRHRAEEAAQRGRDDLAHALRVATLGELAMSLAHEINQPLAAIASNAQAAARLLGKGPVDPEVPEVLRDITADAQRAAGVIRQLRVLFKKEHNERQPVDLTTVITEVLALLRKDLERRRVTVQASLRPDAPSVIGDIVQLQQVMLNVLVNAAEAMADDPGPRELRIALDVGEPGLLALSVRDSGKGVEAAELEQIFDRFVTSKPEGLGMGLSISRSIVEAHGGRMWATRNADRGLTIHIELPCLERAVESKVS